MPRKTDSVIVRTIGIDNGKNALHTVGLDEKGAIVLREKASRHRIGARLVTPSRDGQPRGSVIRDWALQVRWWQLQRVAASARSARSRQ